MGKSIALVCRGDSRDPANWSGIPHSLAHGLEEAGLEIRHVSADLPPFLRRIARRTGSGDDHPRLWSFAARARLRLAGTPEGVVQLGTEFTVKTSAPLVTYEDMTVRQHVELGDEWITRLPAHAIDTWIARQHRIYEQAKVCCVMSRWAADSVIADYGVSPDKVRVVGAGANHVVEPPAGRDWSTPRFLFIGRHWRRKNLPAVLRSFGALRRTMPSAQLHVVGGAPPTRAPGVTVHGSLRLDVPRERRCLEQLLRAATVFVMPSLHEAFGIVYLEAGTAGIPSIGTSVGGAGEAIGPGGLLVDPRSEEELLHAMRELAMPRVAERLGALAREHASQFTWRAVAQRLTDALELEARPAH